MNGNEVPNAAQNNISDIDKDMSFIKTEQKCLKGDYPVEYSFIGACSSVSSALNYVGNMKQTQKNISETIIKSEIETHEEFIKQEEDASEGSSQLKDIEAVYIPTHYKSEELEYFETVPEKEYINKYEKEEPESTTVMDTVTDISFDESFGKKLTKVHNVIKKRADKQTNRNICDICHAFFPSNSHLIRHKNIHTGEKPFKCDQCNKAFSQTSGLTNHKRTHTGRKPFKCEQCNKAFIQSSDLIKHKRTHTGDKPFKCDQCNKAFIQPSDLIRHKRTHTGEKPFKCDQCKKAFSQSTDLIKHKRTHTGEKPFKCEECNKAFSQSSGLINHKRTHTGEKPFKCEQCNKAYADFSNLIKHKRTHTVEK